MEFSEKITNIAAQAEKELKKIFEEIDALSFYNTNRVLDSFREHKVSDAMFAGTSGYGYDDKGRDTLDEIYADIFGCEKALVRSGIVNGTHALTIGLFGLLRPGDTLLSVAGKPYDTLDEVIGISGKNDDGSLADFGVKYRQIELKNGKLDLESIKSVLSSEMIKVVFVQRSKGYLDRRTLTVAEIGELVKVVKGISPETFVYVDNCYGEFTDKLEPTALGADLCAGSLIKNIGGGMAETGAYLAGTARAIELASYRMTSVGTGGEVGCTLGVNKNMYKGLFYAPHTTAQALKTAHFAAYVFAKLGYETAPSWDEPRADIIQTVKTGSAEVLCALCRGIQKGSPVDAFVTPEPWDMPGYSDQVIMAAGTFTQGSSIELSADGPLREPYIAYLQGGLTFEAGKIGIMSAAEEMEKIKTEERK